MVLRFQSFYAILLAELGYRSRGKELRPVSGHLVGRTELVVQPATKDQWVQWPVLFWKGKREEEGGDEPRLATEESQRQRAGRLFVAR
jgi:hypothetical protein